MTAAKYFEQLRFVELAWLGWDLREAQCSVIITRNLTGMCARHNISQITAEIK